MKNILILLLVTTFQSVCIGQNILAENKNANHTDGEEQVLLSPAGKIIKSFKGLKIYDINGADSKNDYRKSTEDLICALDLKTNKMGYLSKTTGNWVIQPQFENPPYVHDFFDGLAIVENRLELGNDQFAVIDKTGKIIVPFCDWTIYDYSDGLAIVEKEGYQFGAIDRNGKLVIDFSVGRLYDFNDGLAIKNNNIEFVDDYDGNTGLWGCVDKTGQMVIEQQWSWIEPFSEDLAVVKNKEGNFGYIDKTGKLTIACTYHFAESFTDGFAVVTVPGDSKNSGVFGMTYIDKTGYQATRKQFDEVRNFKDGLAAVFKIFEVEEGDNTSKFGFLDKNFNLVIPMQNLAEHNNNYNKDFFTFSEGLCLTSTGFIDTKGKQVISFAPNLAVGKASFENGRVVVALYDPKTETYRNTLMDKTGKILWQSLPNKNL
jgi:hypothetical protein